MAVSLRVTGTLTVSAVLCAALGLGKSADEPPARTGGTGSVAGFGRAGAWPLDQLEWSEFSDRLSATLPKSARYAAVGDPDSYQAIVRWPTAARVGVRSDIRTIVIVLEGTLALTAGSTHVLGPLSYAGVPEGYFELTCKEGDCVFYTSLLFAKLLPPLSGQLNESRPPARLFLLDLARPSWKPLPRMRGVDIGKLFDPAGHGGWWRTSLSVDVAALQRWRKGLHVTQADRLILGSALVLSGRVAMAMGDTPLQDLGAGSYMEVPEKAAYSAECQTEQCLLLAAYY